MGLICVFLTYVFNYIADGGLEEFVHSFLRQPQHALGRPLHYLHTDGERRFDFYRSGEQNQRAHPSSPPQPPSLAPPQGSFHALPSVSFVVVDERKGQGDIQGVGSSRRRCPFPRFKCDHEIHPRRRPLGFKALNEVLTKDLTQHGFKSQVHTDSAVRTAWETGRHRLRKLLERSICLNRL